MTTAKETASNAAAREWPPILTPTQKIDAELKIMEAAYKEAASSPEKAVAFLKEVGLLDENGKLAPEFRD